MQCISSAKGEPVVFELPAAAAALQGSFLVRDNGSSDPASLLSRASVKFRNGAENIHQSRAQPQPTLISLCVGTEA